MDNRLAFRAELEGTMWKTERITVWVVTLPNGKKVEIDPSVADRYFKGGSETTPFSHLRVDPIVKTVRVKAVARAASAARRSKRRSPSRSSLMRSKSAKKAVSTRRRAVSMAKSMARKTSRSRR